MSQLSYDFLTASALYPTRSGFSGEFYIASLETGERKKEGKRLLSVSWTCESGIPIYYGRVKNNENLTLS